MIRCDMARIILDGEFLKSGITLDLKWTVEDKDDQRLRGTLTHYKMFTPEELAAREGKDVPQTFAFLLLTRVTVPVVVKDITLRPAPAGELHAPKVFEFELYTDGVVTEEEVKA
jgi:hypothetical protein